MFGPKLKGALKSSVITGIFVFFLSQVRLDNSITQVGYKYSQQLYKYLDNNNAESIINEVFDRSIM